MDTGKLELLLDDPEVRDMVYGLAHVYPAQPTESGPERIRAILQRLVETVDPEQSESWLSDQATNRAISVEQVRTAFGDDVIRDLSGFLDNEPQETASQLTAVLPDLVDALSSDGAIVEVADLRAGLISASDLGDRTSGPFGFHVG